MAALRPMIGLGAASLLFAARPALAQAGHHTHDGFYFRGSLGVGTLDFDLESDLESVPNGNVSGAGTASDLMLGGTPARGLVIGGALLATHSPDPSFDSDPRPASAPPDPSPDVGASFVIIGPFVDFFFDPRKGFHLGGAIGPSAIWYKDLDADESSDREAYAGVGVAAWAGYDAWISSNWSLGGYLRFMAARTQKQVDYSGSPLVDETATGTSLAALFTALYH